MLDTPTVQFALIALLGLFSQMTAWQLRLPAILFLLITGIAFGPVLGIINPDELFGDLLFPLVSTCVALILFEGSLTLNYQEIKGQSSLVQKLCTIGGIITWLMITVATHYIMDVSWGLAFLFGAITIVSGPTVVMPLLRTVRPKKDVANVLRWEGILIDPIGALLAVLVYEFLISTSTQQAFSHTSMVFLRVVLLGGLLGFAAGYLLGNSIRRQWIPDYLHNLATISFVATIFAGANSIEAESGLYAVTIMGVTLANMRNVGIEEIISFKEHLSLFLISAVFIILAARLELDQLVALGVPAIILFFVIQLIVRPTMVFLVSIGSGFDWREKVILSWIYPRGIVAAAVAALLSLHLEHAGIKEGQLLVPLTFAIIIGTVILQSLTAKPLAQALGVAQKTPNGILFIGSNRVSREIAKTLQAQDFEVILADSNWEDIKNARMENLPTFFGNPTSEYAERHLDLSSLGTLVASSPLKDLNALACSKFRSDFGSNNLYYLNSSSEARASAKHQVSTSHRGKILIDEDCTYSILNTQLKKGAKLKTTQLSEEFVFADLLAQSRGLTPLLAIDPKGKIHFFTHDRWLQPKPGWKVCSFLAAADKLDE
ncbi:MAG: sodium:proton antiporter [Sinobacterium sp.]|nr:sodium:proton antiporter [Sinobacterium sp.]